MERIHCDWVAYGWRMVGVWLAFIVTNLGRRAEDDRDAGTSDVIHGDGSHQTKGPRCDSIRRRPVGGPDREGTSPTWPIRPPFLSSTTQTNEDSQPIRVVQGSHAMSSKSTVTKSIKRFQVFGVITILPLRAAVMTKNPRRHDRDITKIPTGRNQDGAEDRDA